MDKRKTQYDIEDALLNVLKDPAIAYYPSSISTLSDYDHVFTDRLLMTSVIKHGLPYSYFQELKDLLPLIDAEWSELLGLSIKSLQRYKKEGRIFKPIHSEKILEITEVILKGLDVFGDKERFIAWLKAPNFAIGGHKPTDLLYDSYGIKLILIQLVRIEHGILA